MNSDKEPEHWGLRKDFPALVIGVTMPVSPAVPAKGNSRRVSSSLSRHAHWTRRHLLDGELTAAQLPPREPARKKADCQASALVSILPASL